MKSYTDLNQSKKLLEFLSLESADMSWVSLDDGRQKYYQAENRKIILNYEKKHWLPCWSLTALMDVLDRGALFKTPKGWACQTYIDFQAITSDYYNNPIDACVAMIEKLHEQKLL